MGHQGIKAVATLVPGPGVTRTDGQCPEYECPIKELLGVRALDCLVCMGKVHWKFDICGNQLTL